MSYKLHEHESAAAFSLRGSGQISSAALPLSLEVVALEKPQGTDAKLNRAISKLIPAALEHRQEILVIQRDDGKYTVCIDHGVPCGTTRESPE